MKSFPYKLLFICIFAPPICYILTLNALEIYFHRQITSRLNDVIIQNRDALYEGRYSIKEEINRNIGKFLLEQRLKYTLGVRMTILVRTGDGQILYPSQYQNDLKETPSDSSLNELNYIEVAAENFRIMNEGLIVTSEVRIKHNGWLSNSILIVYVFLAVFVIQRFVKRSLKEKERRENELSKRIKDLSQNLVEAESQITEIRLKEEDYLKNIETLKKDRESLSSDVDGLLEEMEKLESGLETQRGLRVKREEEVAELKEDLDALKDKLHKPGKRKKSIDSLLKRFKVLYKNTHFTEKAVEGFLSLSDEFQLKAEEVIHRLNEDETKVAVKRKVFGKGGKMNILEVNFSYSGRIYFQKDSQTGITILSIGTKKTQDQDLAFLKREYS